jgi:hypothetical protein
MDDSAQQIIALTLVAVAVAVELMRRYRRKKAGKPGCDGCETGKPQNSTNETRLKFYKRPKQH